jgi:drug/metabolite transporter (DMT)-like permease
MKNEHFKAIIITATGVLLLSLESLLIKLANIDAILFSFYIGVFMFLSVNLVLLQKEKKNFIQTYRTNFNVIMVCGILFGISNIFFINAIKTTTVANTVMIFASAPLFSALYSYLIYKQRSRKNIFISSFFIFIGLFIIFSAQTLKGDFLGNLYALISVNLFALSFVILSQYSKANRFAVTATAGLSAMVFSCFFVNDFTLGLNSLLILLLGGILVSPVSRIFMGIGTRTLPASEVSILMIIETIMAPLWVWLILNEIPSNPTFIGGIIILSTLFFNSLYTIRTNKI